MTEHMDDFSPDYTSALEKPQDQERQADSKEQTKNIEKFEAGRVMAWTLGVAASGVAYFSGEPMIAGSVVLGTAFAGELAANVPSVLQNTKDRLVSAWSRQIENLKEAAEARAVRRQEATEERDMVKRLRQEKALQEQMSELRRMKEVEVAETFYAAVQQGAKINPELILALTGDTEMTETQRKEIVKGYPRYQTENVKKSGKKGK